MDVIIRNCLDSPPSSPYIGKIMYPLLEYVVGLYGWAIYRVRGVQYVHCVMQKYIMVKLGGNEKHIKHIKNT